MKKMRKFCIALLLALALLLVACAQPADPANDESADPTPAAPADDEPSESGLTMDTVRIWFMYGNDPTDMGFVYRQYTDFNRTLDYLGIPSENVQHAFHIRPGDDLDTSISEAIDWGADIIVGGTGPHGPQMLEAAQEHPDVVFLHATGRLAYLNNLPNFHNFFADMASARYLSGIAAGMKTETNILGFVAAMENPEVITGLTGFFLGARSVNPDVTMLVAYVGSFADPARETELATAFIDLGADVIAQHANTPASQIAAETGGVWGVGYNNCWIDIVPDTVLMSPMFDWSVYMTHAIRTIVAGGVLETDYFGTLIDGMVILSDFNDAIMPEGAAEAIEEAKARFLDGWNLFEGPLYDNEGNLIVAAGETFDEETSSAPYHWRFILEGISVIGN